MTEVQPKEYTFKLTIQEAFAVVSALKKLPMEQVEGLVTKLDTQYAAQVKADQEAADAAKAAEVTGTGQDNEKAA